MLGINVIQEFMIRYEELKQDAIPFLMPVANGITVYLHYYLKNIGLWLNTVERWLAIDGKNHWVTITGDKKLVYWPHTVLQKARDLFFIPNHKNAGLNFVKIVIIPFLAFVLLMIRSGCCNILCCCCLLCGSSRREDEETVKMD